MRKLKVHQPPMTIDEQVENLKNNGLIVDDEEYAKRILNDVSYFRLVKAYSLNLKPKNGNYDNKTTFREIVDLYLFNANLRQIIFPEIEKLRHKPKISNLSEQYPDKSISFVSNGLLIVSVLLCVSSFAV